MIDRCGSAGSVGPSSRLDTNTQVVRVPARVRLPSMRRATLEILPAEVEAHARTQSFSSVVLIRRRVNDYNSIQF